MSYQDVFKKFLHSRIEMYEEKLERNENDCEDKAIISAILDELRLFDKEL